MPTLAFEAIGTHWQIDTDLPVGAGLEARVHDLIEDFDRTWSRFRSDSIVTRLAAGPTDWAPDADGARMLDFYDLLYRATGGAVSPLVGRTLEHLGYDASYSLRPRPGTVPVPAWAERIDWDGSTLAVADDTLLDVGAAGKGLLVDLVGQALADGGVDSFLVDAGGDMLHRGPTPVRVALEHPADPTRAIGVVELRDAAICASASNRRVWGGHDPAGPVHHVLDTGTAAPTGEVVATWAIAQSAMVADGLATALFFATGPALQAGLREAAAGTTPAPHFHYVRMTARGVVTHDAGLPGEVFR
ncbi:FAD:protein FMN transferase [Nakamurella alba]|uniref:FAD:protein FMN transferase n=1 Tax=Nakamurella alba TaxID=2665158 RepID=UPI002AC311CF|nr:FAD:protein FMN transferase [Nakamurella alba]